MQGDTFAAEEKKLRSPIVVARFMPLSMVQAFLGMKVAESCSWADFEDGRKVLLKVGLDANLRGR
jgi:hypothetical protein